MSKDRPDWDSYFMILAKDVAKRSNCSRRDVGAIIVKDNRILSTGYNGTPRGIANCCEGGCARCAGTIASGKDLGSCRCSHAEENAIVQAAYIGISTNGATAYTTLSPCLSCAKMIINAGIVKVVYSDLYPVYEESFQLLAEAGLTICKLKPI